MPVGSVLPRVVECILYEPSGAQAHAELYQVMVISSGIAVNSVQGISLRLPVCLLYSVTFPLPVIGS